MRNDITLRIDGQVGRITLNRPEALNALTQDMCTAITAALATWAEDPAVKMLLIEGAGDKAFCAGGDIQEMYVTGTAGDYDYGRAFWADEYRMIAALFRFPKPVASFLHGYTMGGGVGVGCHASHRIVCETSVVSMPEVGIGLVPDVGGSLLLARAPGRIGEYLGLTGARMGPGDAILAEFADYYVPADDWDALKAELVATGDWDAVDRAAQTAPEASLAAVQSQIDRLFSGETLRDVMTDLAHADTDFAKDCRAMIAKNAPLAMACAVELIHRARLRDRIEDALEQEYRFAARAMEKGDFLEGIRAAVIDKDGAPKWRHDSPEAPTSVEVAGMLLPLGSFALKL